MLRFYISKHILIQSPFMRVVEVVVEVVAEVVVVVVVVAVELVCSS